VSQLGKRNKVIEKKNQKFIDKAKQEDIINLKPKVFIRRSFYPSKSSLEALKTRIRVS
jgi:hypothetical protein